MADDKKNIGPEVEKTKTAPAPEQSIPSKAEPMVADPSPAEKATLMEKAEPTTPEAPELSKPDKEARQTAFQGKASKGKTPKQRTRNRKTKQWLSATGVDQ